jgi:formylglycine-generating enzyme required for sulfatase activity
MHNKLQVFLCHASQDKLAVSELYAALKSEGWIDPWLDKAKLLPGQDWKMVIEKAVDVSDVVVICLSNQSVTKDGYVQRELRYAYDLALEKPEDTIFLIPLRLDVCPVPRSLHAFHWVDYFGPQKQETYSDLLKALQLRYDQKIKMELQEVIPIPVETMDLLNSSSLRSRDLGIQDLAKFLTDSSLGLTHAAEEKLREIVAGDDSTKLRQTARDILASHGIMVEPFVASPSEDEKTKREAAEKSTYEKAQLNPTQQASISKVDVKKERTNPAPKTDQKGHKYSTPIPFIVTGALLLVGIFAVGIFLAIKGWSTRMVPEVPTTTEVPVFGVANLPTEVKPTAVIEPAADMVWTVGSTMTSEKDGMTMVYVPAGEFTMGNDQGDADEKPSQKVNLDAFWIDQTEVTNQMYSLCVTTGACVTPTFVGSPNEKIYFGNSKYDNYPVMYVNWDMAKSYCEWAGRDLPTEAQWEKAARGPDGYIYPWGDKFDGRLLNYCDKNCTERHIADKRYDDENVNLAPVGYYKTGASVYSALDMSGNVWEWVNDWYDVYPGGKASASSDFGQKYHVIRGGSWKNNMHDVRSSDRWYFSVGSDAFNAFTGFRCARSE